MIEGSVRKQRDRLRVTIRLVQSSGQLLWSRTYEREDSNTLLIQQEITADVLNAARRHFAMGTNQTDAVAQTTSVEAFEQYLRGRYKSQHFETHDGRSPFQIASALDPQYTLPLIGLARVYQQQAMLGLIAPSDLVGRAKQALGRVLEIDPENPEANSLLGSLLIRHNYNWSAGQPGSCALLN